MKDIAFRDLGIGDAGWLIQRHAETYFEAEGFDASFEPFVAGILLDYLRHRDAACERAWIAHRAGQRLGSVFCTKGAEPGLARLRMFFVEPEARGQGLGERLLALCLGYARERKYRRMMLWTHESHRAACALYARNGFEVASSVPVQNFGCDLVEQVWERVL